MQNPKINLILSTGLQMLLHILSIQGSSALLKVLLDQSFTLTVFQQKWKCFEASPNCSHVVTCWGYKPHNKNKNSFFFVINSIEAEELWSVNYLIIAMPLNKFQSRLPICACSTQILFGEFCLLCFSHTTTRQCVWWECEKVRRLKPPVTLCSKARDS